MFTGVQLSSRMAELCRRTYSEVHLGRLENVILELRESSFTFDQTVSFFALAFVDPHSFPLILESMFAMALHAVTICVNAITPEYNVKMDEVDGNIGDLFDHTKVIDEYELPAGWRMVGKQRTHSWTSPLTGVQVYRDTIRYERSVCEIESQAKLAIET